MEIGRFSFLGILSFLGGLGLLLFQSISRALERDSIWNDIVLGGFTGEALDSYIESIPVELLRDLLFFIMWELPFYQLLLFIGAFFFLLAMIFHD